MEDLLLASDTSAAILAMAALVTEDSVADFMAVAVADLVAMAAADLVAMAAADTAAVIVNEAARAPAEK